MEAWHVDCVQAWSSVSFQSRWDVKILIADDDDVSRRMLQATLIKWRYDVVIACNGIEAWQMLQENNAPKLAILDWMMPGMDGIDVCREIRRRDESTYIYILLLTARN